MKFHKIVPYKIRRALSMAAIIGAPILPIAASCNEIEPHHNTTYVWGEKDWSKIWPADRVAASADSATVDYVILQNDGTSFEYKPVNLLLEQLNMIIDCVTPENRHKIRGAGTLNDLHISSRTQADSLKLVNMGFRFGRVYRTK